MVEPALASLLDEFIGVEAQAAVRTRARAAARFFMANISPLCFFVLCPDEFFTFPSEPARRRRSCMPWVAAPWVKEVTPARFVIPLFVTSFDDVIRKRLGEGCVTGGLFAERSRCKQK